MKKAFILFSLFFLIISTVSCATNFQPSSEEVVNMNLVDQKINPCEDFFQYACGNWLKTNPVPADKAELYRFTEIDENTLLILKNILQTYQRGENMPPQAESQKLGNAYSACLDIDKNEISAKEVMAALLKKNHFLQNKNNLMPLLAGLHEQGINPFFTIYAMQNPGEATQMIGTVDQAGMGLPEKSYYFDKDNLEIRTQYVTHIYHSLLLAGIRSTEALEQAKKIFKLESEIAKISLSAIEQQDPVKTYNPIGKMSLQKLSPQMDWSIYFKALHFETSDTLNIVSPQYFKRLSALLNKTSLTDIKAYLDWQIIHETSNFSTLALQQEYFNFYGKTLNGKKEQAPHWKKCVSSVDKSLGEALGEAFIKVAFGQESKDMADTLVANVKSSLKEMITKLDWMDVETKTGALKKMQSLNQKVGFPKHFKTYHDLAVSTDSWFENQLTSNLFHFNENLKKANLPVDRNEWGMTPPTDNAYYDPTMNEIVFPAGILQAPLFNVHSSIAANYGATGATIGHEMTHGFDDSGSQYDELGNLKNWWSEKSSQTYKEKAQCLIKQYSSYTTNEGIHLNGELSIGENIADLGGLKVALAAYNKTNSQVLDSDLKIFFIAYAQSWCGQLTKEAARTQINSDTHSLPKFRVNGVVSNLPEFADAFQCMDTQAMAPKNRCSVW
ncbi:MAG: M13 family metallopeptidase [Bacteriovorax sp.]|nr:M13 family metallopeptidase [Bacteriovorax sp.]